MTLKNCTKQRSLMTDSNDILITFLNSSFSQWLLGRHLDYWLDSSVLIRTMSKLSDYFTIMVNNRIFAKGNRYFYHQQGWEPVTDRFSTFHKFKYRFIWQKYFNFYPYSFSRNLVQRLVLEIFETGIYISVWENQ